jgi:hypothetical protein
VRTFRDAGLRPAPQDEAGFYCFACVSRANLKPHPEEIAASAAIVTKDAK